MTDPMAPYGLAGFGVVAAVVLLYAINRFLMPIVLTLLQVAGLMRSTTTDLRRMMGKPDEPKDQT